MLMLILYPHTEKFLCLLHHFSTPITVNIIGTDWMIHVVRISDVCHLFTLLYCFNYSHFCFHHYRLALLSCTSNITTAFLFAFRYPGLEIKILYCCTLYSSIQYTKVKVKSLSRVWLFATPWTVAYQAPLSMGFSRQECWSGLPFPSPGDLPNPGIEPGSPALQADALPSEPLGKPYCIQYTKAQPIIDDSYSWQCIRAL